MNADGRSLALTLVGWCAALLPADRAPWAAAMKAEVGAIEDGKAALSFAAGCVWVSIKERVLTKAFAARSVMLASICGMLTLSLLSAAITRRIIDAHAPSALDFGLTSALFAAAAAWSYQMGPKVLVKIAGTMIPLYGIAYAFGFEQGSIVGEWTNAKLYQALAIEGIFIWASLLVGGVFVLRIESPSINKRTGSRQ